jgi:tetratricopeptide (TPR) repeat protein
VLFALAATLATAFIGWQVVSRWTSPPVEPLATLARLGSVTGVRPGIARTSLPFPWTALDVARGPGTLPAEAREHAARLERLAGESREPDHLHALGVARLVQGQVNEAVEALQQAVDRSDAPALDHRLDLAAALLERSRRDDEPFDATRALDQLALMTLSAPATPASQFNTALALTLLRQDARAAEAWRAYLQLDSTSPWADEARDRLRAIEGAGPGAGSASGSMLSRYRSLEDLLVRWRPEAPESWPRVEAVALAAEVLDAGGDRQLPDLVARVVEAGGWPDDRRRCLARGLAARAAAVAAFDDAR